MNLFNQTPRFQKASTWLSNKNLIFFAFLLLLNITIFWEHYFNNVGFSWDFRATYYAWPAFWTTSVSMGIFPQWVPYQSMGYPLAINTEVGLYYPIFWIFALFHIPYTLHAAVIVQVLHVLFGSIGMFLLLKLIFKSSYYAFIGAIAFQFFGGFYAQALDPDFVRAFAIAPWLFYVFKINIDHPKITRRILFIPIVIYFLATGAYPGIFISSILVLALFLFFQIAGIYVKHPRKLFSLKIGGVVVGLAILGISISIIHLGPFYQERNKVTRFNPSPVDKVSDQKKLQLGSLSIERFPLLFMPDGPSNDQVWKFAFVSLPLLVFASFIPMSAIKRHWVFVIILILSLLMIPGLYSPVWQALTSTLPSLKLSDFPITDYIVFVAIPLIILGIAGLKAIIERGLSLKEFIVRAAFVAAWFSVGLYSLSSKLGFFYMPWQKCYFGVHCHTQQLYLNSQVVIAGFILFISIIVILYYYKKNRVLLSENVLGISKLGLLVIVLLISFDGFRFVDGMQTWKERPLDRSYIAFHMPLERNGKLITYSIFESIPSERPARETTVEPHSFSWKGYLQGTYMMSDYTGTVLTARRAVEYNGVYTKYMFLKWTPILLEPSLAKSNDSTKIILPVSTFSNIIESQIQAALCYKYTCDSAFSNKHLIQPEPHSGLQDVNASNNVVQTRYGINDISYQIALREPKLMVENEMYFPGWQADLIFPHKEMKITASVVDGVFRAWLLPAGDYIMIAHFSFPNLIIYQTIALVSFGVWVFIIARYWRRLNHDNSQPITGEEFVSRS